MRTPSLHFLLIVLVVAGCAAPPSPHPATDVSPASNGSSETPAATISPTAANATLHASANASSGPGGAASTNSTGEGDGSPFTTSTTTSDGSTGGSGSPSTDGSNGSVAGGNSTSSADNATGGGSAATNSTAGSNATTNSTFYYLHMTVGEQPKTPCEYDMETIWVLITDQYDHGVANATVNTTWHFKSLVIHMSGPTNESGVVHFSRYIGNQPPGEDVPVDVYATRPDGWGPPVTAKFTPIVC